MDCAALPENLVLSTLFGHEKGAFTGADKALPGLIAQAHGGTLLLDEVGELAPAMQKIFLRVLQERRYRPLGAGSDRVSDFRLIAATHRNLEDMVQQGTFRQDLYYRLASLVITLPPLKDRDGDLYELTLYHLDRLYQRQGVAPKEVEPEFFHALACHDWPGNVRELMQVLEGALAQARDHKLLLTRHLPAYLRAKWARARMLKSREALVGDGSPAKAGESLPPLADVRQAVWQQVEENYLRDLLHRTRGDFHSACQISGLSRARFYALLKKHQLSCSAACH